MEEIYVPPRTILLPNVLDYRLRTFAGMEEERMGVLFYVRRYNEAGLNCRVDGLLTTGIGTNPFVDKNHQMQEVLNAFFLSNQEYRYIEWHTHPNGIQTHSPEDLEAFVTELMNDPYFIGMIITKTRRSIFQDNGPGSEIKIKNVRTPNDFDGRQNVIFSKLEESAIKLGYPKMPNLITARNG